MPATFDYAAWEASLSASGIRYDQVNVPTYGTVKYYELAKPGPQLSFTDNTHRCERQFVVWPYEDVWAFCAWQLGWSYLDPLYNGVGAGVFRVVPQALPVKNQRTLKPLAYATGVTRTEGWVPDGFQFPVLGGGGEGSFGGAYALGKVTVAYSTVVPPVRLDSQMSRHPVSNHPDEGTLQRGLVRMMAPSAKHVQFPSGAMRWRGAGLPLARSNEVSSQPFGRIIPFADVTYMWQQVPAIPQIALRACGKVNATSFDNEFDAQTLQVTSVEITPGRQVTGERMFNVAYRMRLLRDNQPKPLSSQTGQPVTPVNGATPIMGHNYFLRFYKANPGDQASAVEFVWDMPYSGAATDPKPVFEAEDFRDLFRGPFILNNWIL